MIEEEGVTGVARRPSGLDSLLEQVWEHHFRARVRLGCAAHPIGSAPVAGLDMAPPEDYRTPVVAFTHPALPWWYFNHAMLFSGRLPKPGTENRRDVIQRAGDILAARGRERCFEIALPRPEGALPDSKLLQGSREWQEELQCLGYTPCDDLVVMVRSAHPSDADAEPLESSPFLPAGGILASLRPWLPWGRPEARETRIAKMPAGRIQQQIRVHREGFEVPLTRSARLDRQVLEINLCGGVEYLWAVPEGWRWPVGSTAVITTGETAEIFSLSVAPAYRRRGIARRLLRAAVSHAARQGARRFFLEAEEGSPATALYLSCGFQPLWRRVTFVPANPA